MHIYSLQNSMFCYLLSMSNINNMLFLVASERNAPCLNWSSETCFFRFSYIGAICHIMYFHVYILQTACRWRGAHVIVHAILQSQGSVGSKSGLQISDYLRTFPVFASSTAHRLSLYLCALPFYCVSIIFKWCHRSMKVSRSCPCPVAASE